MPYLLKDISANPINIKLDEASLAPDKIVETMNHLQNEINLYNARLLSILVEALGDVAYLSKTLPRDEAETTLGSCAYTDV
jgi:hypothetical protein